jgi:hypothetical protein
MSELFEDIEPDYHKTIGTEACRRYMLEQPYATAIEMFAWIEANSCPTYCGWSDADIDDLGIKGTDDLTAKERKEVMELFESRFDASQGIGNEDLREALVNVTGLDEPDEDTD